VPLDQEHLQSVAHSGDRHGWRPCSSWAAWTSALSPEARASAVTHVRLVDHERLQTVSSSSMKTTIQAEDDNSALRSTQRRAASRRNGCALRGWAPGMCGHASPCTDLGILGRRLVNVCVKLSEDEVESGVRSTSADTLSDQPPSEWSAGREGRSGLGAADGGGRSDRPRVPE
jgi:hypothetical protein